MFSTWKSNVHTEEGNNLTSKIVVEAEIGRRVRPISQTQHVAKGCARGQCSGSGDAPGGTWSCLDTCLPKAVGNATTKGSSVHGMMRKRPPEEERTVLKTQADALLQDETNSLDGTHTQVLFPRLDVEGRSKMTWTVRLRESGRDKSKVLTFLTKMCVVTQEGYKLRCPLGGGQRHEERPFPHQLRKGKLHRPPLENVKDLERVPRRWVSPARGPLLENPPHQSLDEGVIPNIDAVNRRHSHGNGGFMDGYGAPRHTHVEEVREVVDDVPQRRLMERNGGSAQERLEGLPSPLVPIL